MQDLTSNEGLIANESNKEMIISPTSMTHLLEAAKWARFLSILGFIGLAFMTIVSFSIKYLFSLIPTNFPQEIPPINTSFITFIYLFFTAILFFPILFLFNFSVKTIRAIKNKSGIMIEKAMKNLKRHYMFIGILFIISITLQLISVLFAVIIGSIL